MITTKGIKKKDNFHCPLLNYFFGGKICPVSPLVSSGAIPPVPEEKPAVGDTLLSVAEILALLSENAKPNSIKIIWIISFKIFEVETVFLPLTKWLSQAVHC